MYSAAHSSEYGLRARCASIAAARAGVFEPAECKPALPLDLYLRPSICTTTHYASEHVGNAYGAGWSVMHRTGPGRDRELLRATRAFFENDEILPCIPLPSPGRFIFNAPRDVPCLSWQHHVCTAQAVTFVFSNTPFILGRPPLLLVLDTYRCVTQFAVGDIIRYASGRERGCGRMVSVEEHAVHVGHIIYGVEGDVWDATHQERRGKFFYVQVPAARSDLRSRNASDAAFWIFEHPGIINSEGDAHHSGKPGT
jgi:hypothetical protein